MNIENLTEALKDQPQYRIKQAEKAVFDDLVGNWNEVTTLPQALRQKLNRECPLKINGEIFKTDDKKTIKALLTLDDGQKIEAVLMLHQDKRHTVCVSSQVGCALKCGFCTTGQQGFKRNLTAEEMISQVLFFGRYLKKNKSAEDRITNVVFMGMGEPLLNYSNVMSAIKFINSEKGLNIGARKISISTAGVISGIKKLANEKLQINLAISLHAANDKLRQKLMPIAQDNNLEELIKAMDDYLKKTKRQVMIEYILIDGINDSVEQAKELADLLKGRLVMVNLIACNPVKQFKPSPAPVIAKFKNMLLRERIVVTERYRYGREIDAACGQLAGGKNA